MNSTFGPWLREKRLELGYTQEELAHILKVGKRTYQSWETWTKYRPSKRVIPELARLFGVSEEEVNFQVGYEVDARTKLPAVVTGNVGCESCGGRVLLCRAMINQDLPVLCEKVTVLEFELIQRRGLEDVLLATRGQ